MNEKYQHPKTNADTAETDLARLFELLDRIDRRVSANAEPATPASRPEPSIARADAVIDQARISN